MEGRQNYAFISYPVPIKKLRDLREEVIKSLEDLRDNKFKFCCYGYGCECDLSLNKDVGKEKIEYLNCWMWSRKILEAIGLSVDFQENNLKNIPNSLFFLKLKKQVRGNEVTITPLSEREKSQTKSNDDSDGSNEVPRERSQSIII